MPDGVSVCGEKPAVTPAGRPLTLRVTGAPKPPTAVRLTTKLAVPPGANTCVAGAMASVKSGGAGVPVAVVVAVGAGVRVAVAVRVNVRVGVFVAVDVAPSVGVTVGVLVTVEAGVGVGVGSEAHHLDGVLGPQHRRPAAQLHVDRALAEAGRQRPGALGRGAAPRASR